MESASRVGRPRVSSRETLAEAACELYLERGYGNTSVSDITLRAGVSRSSFFNYFSSKHELLWYGVDERIDALEQALSQPDGPGLAQALGQFATDLRPDTLALAIVNAEAMAAEADLERETALRALRIGRAVSAWLRFDGANALRAQVLGAAYGAALMVALQRWAIDGAGRTSLESHLHEALAIIAEMPAE